MSEAAHSPSIIPLSLLFFACSPSAHGESTSTFYYLSFLRFVLASLPPKTRNRATFVLILVFLILFFFCYHTWTSFLMIPTLLFHPLAMSPELILTI
jgi:hypothetical protein